MQATASLNYDKRWHAMLAGRQRHDSTKSAKRKMPPATEAVKTSKVAGKTHT